VEFHSPGRLPSTVTIESIRMGASHVLRNPRIYSFFVRMGLVTDISGVARMIKLVRERTGKGCCSGGNRGGVHSQNSQTFANLRHCFIVFGSYIILKNQSFY
jgi:hypothetical protein